MLAAFPAEHGLEMQYAYFLVPHTNYCSKYRHTLDPPHPPKEPHVASSPFDRNSQIATLQDTPHSHLVSLCVSLSYENVIQNSIKSSPAVKIQVASSLLTHSAILMWKEMKIVVTI